MAFARVIDFETTGENPPDAQVCQVGICDVTATTEQTVISMPSSWFCSVPDMHPAAQAVHHIRLEDCASAPPFNAEDLYYNNPNLFAAHAANFEVRFFQPRIPVLCTYKAALRVWPEAPSHSNFGLLYWLEGQVKVTPERERTMPAHRAGPDAYVTAHILSALLAAGVSAKLMVAWTREPAALPTCPIGEWRGKPWSEVEWGFLDWMLRQKTMEPELKWNAQRELDRRAP